MPSKYNTHYYCNRGHENGGKGHWIRHDNLAALIIQNGKLYCRIHNKARLRVRSHHPTRNPKEPSLNWHQHLEKWIRQAKKSGLVTRND